MIIITGAAGFISSCLISKLNQENFRDLVLVDDFSQPLKAGNYSGKAFRERVEREHFFDWVKGKEKDIQFIFHLGARTDTAEMDRRVFDHLNVNYSKAMWKLCTAYQIPLVYASSAATYGGGEQGFDDEESLIDQLRPLNPYGESKQQFDLWALQQDESPFFWAGIKFFNVYGPNEYHKGRMASVVFHTYHQILKTGKMNLFRSHKPGIADGAQQRDFVYVKDVVAVLYYLMQHRKHSGVYNLGSGQARTFKDLATQVFVSMGRTPQIEFIDTPEDIRENYQYFTEARMEKLLRTGYSRPFYSLESGVQDYVENYLIPSIHF